jgi:uncharacterized membrane protein YjgN (DUF898 family)
MIVTVVCPHCGHSRETPRERIPPRPVRTVCPKCRQVFPFSGHLGATPAAAAPRAATVQPDHGSSSASAESAHSLVFTGRAGEYFGIWIVNLLLKLVTVGLYSVWAKVRKRHYFYANTLLDGAPFQYTADPWTLFRGWCLAAAAFLLYSMGSQVSLVLGGVFGLVLFLAVPWVIVRSRMFGARNTSHRNVRFTFRPNYREAYVVYGALPLLVPFTLGLAFPYMVYRQRKFQVENSGYGRTSFTFAAGAGDFYRLFLRVGLGLITLLAILGAAAALLGPGVLAFSRDPAAFAAVAPLLVAGSVLLYLFVATYVQTRVANLQWNATRFANARMVSTLRARDMVWLYVSSAAAIVCSFGLLTPWASVRLARYRLSRLAMLAAGELRALAAPRAEVGPAGEEFGDFFGIEVGLG